MVSWQALEALSSALDLHNVGPRTCAVLFTDSDGSTNDLAALTRAALDRLGASAIEVRPAGSAETEADRLRATKLIPAVLAGADIAIDATSAAILAEVELPPYTDVLRLLASAVHAQDWPPHASLSTRVDHVGELVAKAREFVIQDDHGTNLAVALDSVRVRALGGRSQPANGSQFPSGSLQLVPGEGTVDGDLILMPGDANTSRRIHISSPIRFTVKADRIVAIDGDNPDADVLRALLESMDTRDAFGIATIGLGLNPGRGAVTETFDDVLLDRSTAELAGGVVTVAFGNNPDAGRPCPGRVGLSLGGRSVAVDGVALCHRGKLVGEAAPDVYEVPG